MIGIHGAGRFLGELNVVLGQPAFVTAGARDHGEVLAVPVDAMQEIVSRHPSLGDIILGAHLIRRSMLVEAGTGLRIVGSHYSPETPHESTRAVDHRPEACFRTEVGRLLITLVEPNDRLGAFTAPQSHQESSSEV